MKEKKTELVTKEEASTLFAEAKIKAQEERHKRLDQVFDAALNILSDTISDPSLSNAEKVFPAKTAIDVYLTKEKFLREDARYELDKEKLKVDAERLKLERDKLSAPGGPLYVVQKVENQTIQVKASDSDIKLKKRKLAQAKALEEASGIAQFVEVPSSES